MPAREHRETHDVEQTKKMVPHVTRETQHIWFGSLVLTWFCRTTNQAQLCGLWTRVSLLDFVLWWSSWSRLHCSQKMYNWNSPWEECVLVGTISTVDNWSTSRLLFSFGAVHSQSSIQRNDYCFCRTVGYWRLLLAHPTDGDKMLGFKRYIRLLPKLMLSPQGRQQNLSLGINLIDNAELCFPHHSVVCNHSCYECKKPTEPSVCRKPESILWLLLQVCWKTIKCLVYQFVPSTSISRQFVGIRWTMFPLIQVLLVWIDDHPSTDLKLCEAAPLFCVPTRSIAQRIFEHVLPCRRTTPPSLREAFSHPGNFSVAPPEMRDSNIFVCCSIMISIGLHSRWVHPKHTWSRNDVGSSRSMLFINFLHNGVIFCFFPAIFYVVHVDFESSRSPATSESWNSPNLQCCGVLPIWE